MVRLEGLGKLKRIHLIGTRTRDLPDCSIVPQPTIACPDVLSKHSYLDAIPTLEDDASVKVARGIYDRSSLLFDKWSSKDSR
jgi:hypothetical protein